MLKTNIEIIELQEKLRCHPVYDSIKTIEDLRCFTEHHIYSVWDFMSLVKYLQSEIAPATYPWFPEKKGNQRRFINEIVLEEESDVTLLKGKYLSHFEIYQLAMNEIGADTIPSRLFIEFIKRRGISELKYSPDVPLSAEKFIRNTFNFIQTKKLHVIASAFTFGRETIVPLMFRSILNTLGVSKEDCPTFYYYIWTCYIIPDTPRSDIYNS